MLATTSTPTQKQIHALLTEMSLDEKIAQLNAYWFYELMDGALLSESKVRLLFSDGIGQVTRLAGASVFSPVEVARAANAIQRFLVNETRLKIPAIVHEECCAGYVGLGGTTYPQMIGLASSWMPELAEKMTAEIRKQVRAVGAHQGLAPVLDIARDPRWGRVEETFGEDPTLASHFGVSYIKGLQGDSLAAGGVMATGKHFIGHSLSQGGQNCAPVHMGPRDMWDIYMLPFQAAVRDAGLHTIMNAYPELDGEVVAASRRILTDILRGQLGFDGVVVSDYEAIMMLHTYHRMAPDLARAGKLGIEAGIDVELPTRLCYGDAFKALIEKGEINIEFVDTSVKRHLEKKFELGLFENPFVDEGSVLEVFETPAQRQLAREIASKSIVLLKNDGLLPLKKDIKTLAVIGPNAHTSRNLVNGYSYHSMLELMQFLPPAGSIYENVDQGQIASHSIKIPTILEAVSDKAGKKIKVLYAKGCDVNSEDRSGFAEAVEAARQADVVLLVLGDSSGLVPACTVGETRDSDSLRLTGLQEELARAIGLTGKPVAVILVNGRPLVLDVIEENANAILEAWIPGEEGGAAIAGTLFGDANPGGKLAMTFPRSVGQVPIVYNQKPSGGRSNWYINYVSEKNSPFYAFGHGLSYTRFDYSELEIESGQVKAGQVVNISVKVSNTGQCSGDEVVQLYVQDEYASMPRPVSELRGFKRISLQPGEIRELTFHLPVDQLAYYDSDLRLMLEPGTFKVMVGAASDDIRLTGNFELIGERNIPIRTRLYDCPVTLT